ncbi:unnamed protein product, partial [Amoebophrya sp. A25]
QQTQKRVLKINVVRDKYYVPRARKNAFRLLQEEGFSVEQMEKLRMFVPSFEEVKQKVKGFPVGTKIWDRDTGEIGVITSVDSGGMLEHEAMAEVRFTSPTEAGTTTSRRATVGQLELQNPLWFTQRGMRPRYEVTYDNMDLVRTTFEINVVDVDEEMVESTLSGGQSVRRRGSWDGSGGVGTPRASSSSAGAASASRTASTRGGSGSSTAGTASNTDPLEDSSLTARLAKIGQEYYQEVQQCEKIQGRIPVGAVGFVRAVTRNVGGDQTFSVEFRSPLLDFTYATSPTAGARGRGTEEETDQEQEKLSFGIARQLKLFNEYGTFTLRSVTRSRFRMRWNDPVWKKLTNFEKIYGPNTQVSTYNGTNSNSTTVPMVDSATSSQQDQGGSETELDPPAVRSKQGPMDWR